MSQPYWLRSQRFGEELIPLFLTSRNPAMLERVTALHESGHALVGVLRGLNILEVQLGPNDEGRTSVCARKDTPGILAFLYAGFCAELEFGCSPQDAGLGATDDFDLAQGLFPGHSPSAE